MASILYGLPDFSDTLVKELDAGHIALGGCIVFGGDPKWQCKACGHLWGGAASDGVLAALGCAILFKFVENLAAHRQLVTESGLLPMGQWLAAMAILAANMSLG